MKKFIFMLSTLFSVSLLTGCELMGENPQSNKHNHVFDKKIITDTYLAENASCIEPAIYYYSCECGKKGINTFENGDALGHSFTDFHSDNNATHLKDGTKTAKCDRCNETKTITDENSKLENHNFILKIVNDDTLAKSATCTEPAKYYYSCECGELSSKTFNQGEPTGHSFTNYVSDHNATHMEDGTKTAKCDYCEQHETVIDVGSRLTDHSFNMKVPSNKYLYSNATCTEPAKYYYSCECGEKGTTLFEDGEALGHKFINYVSDHNATHMEDGTKTAKCERCEETNTISDDNSKIKDHDFCQQIVSSEYKCSEATCTQPATYYYSCECGEKSNKTFEYGEPKGHKFINYVSDHNATHMEDGTKTAKCEFCNAKDTVIDDGSRVANHNFNLEQVSEKYLRTKATCTSAATYFYSCECGEKGTSYFSSGSALGHSFTNYVSDENATCIEDGTKTAICDRCDETNTVIDSDSKTPHVFDNKLKNEKTLCSEGDCLHKALYFYSCSVCAKQGILTLSSETFEGNYGTHKGGTQTCCQKAICDICKSEYGEYGEHIFTDESDTCLHCSEKKFLVDHFKYKEFNENGYNGYKITTISKWNALTGTINELRLPSTYHNKTVYALESLYSDHFNGGTPSSVTINKLIIPKSYKYLDLNIKPAFKEEFSNVHIKNIVFEGTIEEWCSIKFGHFETFTGTSKVEFYRSKISFDIIENLMINSEVIKNVVINKKTNVNYGCLTGYSKLESFVANSMVVLENGVFDGTPVKEINLGNGVAYSGNLRDDDTTSYGRMLEGVYCLEKLTVSSICPRSYATGVKYGLANLFGCGSCSESYFYLADQINNRNYIPRTLKEIVYTGRMLYDNAFMNFTSLTKLTVGMSKKGEGLESNFYDKNSSTLCGKNAFYNCTSLLSANLYVNGFDDGDAIQVDVCFGKDSFYGCSKATINVYIPYENKIFNESEWNPLKRPVNLIRDYNLI